MKKIFLNPAVKPEAHLVTITPEVARHLLKLHNNRKQRVVDKKYVEMFANDMKNGNWQVNGSSIGQTVSGALADGNKRVTASANFNVSFTTVFVKGLPEDAIETIDTNSKKRTGKDLIDLNFDKPLNSNHIAGAASFLIRFIKGHAGQAMGSASKVSSIEHLDFIRSRPDFIKHITTSRRLRDKGDRLLPSRLFYGGKYLTDKADISKSQEFWEQISYGVNIAKGSPTYHLRLRMLRSKNAKGSGRLSLNDKLKLVISAWNKFYRDPEKSYASLPLKNNIENILGLDLDSV